MIEGTVEDIPDDLIGKTVDIIISEPLGTFLLNERMLETYIIARDKFLKPEGKMFPTTAHFCIYPFNDEQLYKEQMQKCNFWTNKKYHGLDLSSKLDTIYWHRFV